MVKKSPENTTPAIVDNVEALEAKLAQMQRGPCAFCYVHAGAGRQDLLRGRHGRQQGSYPVGEDGHRGDRPRRS